MTSRLKTLPMSKVLAYRLQLIRAGFGASSTSKAYVMVHNIQPFLQIILHLMQTLDFVLSKGFLPPPQIVSENECLKTIRREEGKKENRSLKMFSDKFTLFTCSAPKYITCTIFTPQSYCLVNISRFQRLYDLPNSGGNWEVISFDLLRKEVTAEAAVLGRGVGESWKGRSSRDKCRKSMEGVLQTLTRLFLTRSYGIFFCQEALQSQL